MDRSDCAVPMRTSFHVPEKVDRNIKPEGSLIAVKGNVIGGKGITIIAGPCAVESREQLFETARLVSKNGARILRGGAFKPRSSPYSFQGLGEEGLKLLKEISTETGQAVVTEVMDTRQIELVLQYADILQIGSRNMQNYPLLKEAGMTRKPILLKRGMMATIEEFLMAAEYILNQGNDQVILCERGIRTFETETRNTRAVTLKRCHPLRAILVSISSGRGCVP